MARVVFYTAEVICALEFLHGNNRCLYNLILGQKILYRDLKPENIMLTSTGHIKLVDFGFSKQLTDQNLRTMTNCGTPAYTAPEVIKGFGHSFEVDIWSLGVLICELING